MKKSIIAVIILMTSFSQSESQAIDIDTTTFNKLITKDGLPYKNKNGEFLGCGYTYECKGMSIIFYLIRLDKRINRITVKGKLFDHSSNMDSSGVCCTHIFLATPKKNGLTNIKSVGATYYRYLKDSSTNAFLHRNGDFLLVLRLAQKTNCILKIHYSGQ